MPLNAAAPTFVSVTQHLVNELADAVTTVRLLHISVGLFAQCITGALSSMQQSSAEAARILKAHDATACTDVTGFGLVGHLVEMTRPSQVHCTPHFACDILRIPCCHMEHGLHL